MKTAALVPIKLNNERTPGKNTKCFDDGTPLIHLILNILKNCREIDDIYVYCSDEAIKNYLIPDVHFLKRDRKFDGQDVSINEILYAFSNDILADIYILAHATAPFQKSRCIDQAIKMVKSGEYDSALAVVKMQKFMWKNNKPVNYDIMNIPRTQDLEPVYTETSGMYVFTRAIIQKKRSRIGDHPYLMEVSELEAVDIDYPVDFQIANSIYMDMMKKQRDRNDEKRGTK